MRGHGDRPADGTRHVGGRGAGGLCGGVPSTALGAAKEAAGDFRAANLRPRPVPQLEIGTAWCPAAAGAGRWMRSSRAPGPARSGCGTRRAASGWCAAPTPPIRPRRPGGDRGGSLRPSRPRPFSSTTARDLAARQARRGGRGLGAARPSRCDGPVLERSGRGAATCSAGHVEHGDDGALGLVPGRDHLGRRQQLHLAAVAL
jgi:hypothetical protein